MKSDTINKIIKEFREKFTLASFAWNVDSFSGNKLAKQTRKKVIYFLTLSLEKAIQEAREETARDICQLLDDIELKQQFIKGSTLEEWKQWKHIRNAIRDKYLKKG